MGNYTSSDFPSQEAPQDSRGQPQTFTQEVEPEAGKYKAKPEPALAIVKFYGEQLEMIKEEERTLRR